MFITRPSSRVAISRKLKCDTFMVDSYHHQQHNTAITTMFIQLNHLKIQNCVHKTIIYTILPSSLSNRMLNFTTMRSSTLIVFGKALLGAHSIVTTLNTLRYCSSYSKHRKLVLEALPPQQLVNSKILLFLVGG